MTAIYGLPWTKSQGVVNELMRITKINSVQGLVYSAALHEKQFSSYEPGDFEENLELEELDETMSTLLS